MATSELFGKNPGFFYVQLVDKGYYDAALRLIRRDQHNPIRASFWGGLGRLTVAANMRRPKRTGIRCCTPHCLKRGRSIFWNWSWRTITWGDKEGRGLAIVLDGLRREQEVALGQLFLAGLGWAMRRRPHRRTFQLSPGHDAQQVGPPAGRLLPRFWWAFCADLLPATAHNEYAHYFDSLN
jgi:hypothetical protein